jgi:hypothetical protein
MRQDEPRTGPHDIRDNIDEADDWRGDAWEPGMSTEPPPHPGPNGSAARPIIDATPYIYRPGYEIEPRRWIYGHHLIRRYASSTIGAAGGGKSSLELVEAIALATGRPLLGITPAEGPVRCWYWNGEDPREEIDRRIAAVTQHYGITAEDIGGRLFIDSGRDTEIIIATQEASGIVIAQPIVAALNATIVRHKIDVVIIDPFISCHRVQENDNPAIDRVTKQWAAIAEDGNCAVDLVHHVRKGASGSNEYQVDDARGAVAMIAAVRSARVLNVMTMDEAEKAGVNPGERKRHFRAENGKANLAPPPETSDWYRLESVSLGNSRGTWPADNVQVVTIWRWPDQADEVSVHDLIEVQKRISKGEYREDARAEKWAGNVVAEVMGFDQKDRAARAGIRNLLQSWIVTGALRRVSRRDDARKTRTFIEVGTWVGL